MGTTSLGLSELKFFSPLDELDAEGLRELSGKLHIESLPRGRKLFVRGQSDRWHFFLLEGAVTLTSPGKPELSVTAGTHNARLPLNHCHPRQYTLFAETDIEFVRIDSNLLELLLSSEKLPVYEVEELAPHAESTQEKIFSQIVHDYIKDKLVVPSMPEVALKIRSATNDPDAGIDQIVSIVQLDPAISARIVQIANSSAYRSAQPIDSLKHAIERLGFSLTSNLAIHYSMQQLFKAETKVFNNAMQSQWLYNARIAALSYVLAMHGRGLNPEWAFLAGMLHRIGALPIISHAQSYQELAKNPETLAHIIDRLGSDVSAMVLRKWGFGEDIVTTALESDVWLRNRQRYADYCDVILCARLHDLIGRQQTGELPLLDSVPAVKKVAGGRLTPEGSIAVLSDAEELVKTRIGLLMNQEL